MDYFQNLDVTTNWKDHNVALKWFREGCERKGTQDFYFSNMDPETVAQIVHEKGTAFSFDEAAPLTPWRWQEMVAQWDENSMTFVVEGPPDNRSRGIVKCRLQHLGLYDHKREHAQRRNGSAGTKQFGQWDFVLECEDKTNVALHLNFSHTKVDCKYSLPVPDDELPMTGAGGTSGPGTFKHFIKKHVDCNLKFDALKNGKVKGKGKSQPQSRADLPPLHPPRPPLCIGGVIERVE